MMRSLLGVVLAVGSAAVMIGCRKSEVVIKQPPVKQYHLRGKVVAVAANGNLRVNAGAIPGLMEAMTMSYKMVDPSVASEITVGDEITATVLVDDTPAGPLNPRLDQIVVVGEANPNDKSAVSYNQPTTGQVVPDFKMVNQAGKQIHLEQFRGQVLLVTFIYTRCPFPDFCPRMNSNFAELEKKLAETKIFYPSTHLLSISFDPEYDTPKVLRAYGATHAGRVNPEDFAHWDFAVPSTTDLPTIEQWFGLGVTGNTKTPSSIQHSLSTVLISKDGKVIQWYPSNEWKPDEIYTAIQQALE